QHLADRLGAVLRQALIVLGAAGRIGVAVDEEHRSPEVFLRQHVAERNQRRQRLRTDDVGIVVEVDLEIDARLLLDNLDDLGALLRRRRRSRLDRDRASAQLVDELLLLGRLRIGRGDRTRVAAAEAAGQAAAALRLQGVVDLVLERGLREGSAEADGQRSAREREFSDQLEHGPLTVNGAVFAEGGVSRLTLGRLILGPPYRPEISLSGQRRSRRGSHLDTAWSRPEGGWFKAAREGRIRRYLRTAWPCSAGR